VISSNFDWFIAGQTAVAAADQVKIGYDYQAGITMMNFWEKVRSLISISVWVFIALFASTFFNKKTEEKTNEAN
jgi:hypothetical protein